MVDGGDQEPAIGRSQGAEPAGAKRAATGWSLVLGYVVGGLSVVLASIAVVAMIAGFGGSDDDHVEPDPTAHVTVPVLPDGGVFEVPEEVDSVEDGAAAGGCELESFEVKSRDHVVPGGDRVRYSSDPPTSGMHDPVPAQDGAYSDSPDVQQLVHTLEHGRVIVWFERDLPIEARASLKAYFDHDPALMILVPDTTGMPYEIAATAWNRKPGRYGTGRLLGCREYSGEVYTALEAFKKHNRGRGPELIP